MKIAGVLYVFTACLFLAGACGYDDFGDYPPEGPESFAPNTDIGRVRFLCGESGVYNVTDSLIIGGYVSANDKSGNIYRSFFIDDGTGAIEVRAGMYSLHNVYTRGRYVAVKLAGMTLSVYNGTLQAGLSVNENGAGVGYIDNWAVAGDFILPSNEFGIVMPEVLTVQQLLPEHCGRLVSLPGMKFAPKEKETEDGDEDDQGIKERPAEGFDGFTTTWAVPISADNPVPRSAYRPFDDSDGNTINVYTSGYAVFAGETVPEGSVTLTGILSRSGSIGWIIRLRDTGDVKNY